MDLQSFAPRAKVAAMFRDGDHCIFTKDGTKDVAYICPISLNIHEAGYAHDVLWDILRTIWSESKVNSWFKTLFPNGDYRDACHNLLCLSASAHRFCWHRQCSPMESYHWRSNSVWRYNHRENRGPETMPLPNWDILEMQWFLQRAAAMSGVADIDNDENEDDEISGLADRYASNDE
ncbi:uncharacterized protein TRUGW13939_04024 [Talaromyces rugulosus]|uniref:HNH nuclease domain-containing protein n=1 Tax=Talaromyces rugulosus TaxID=121627 RepID=A0A7H8QSZ2_TALRU|nr:uncharacterized protein TRUGW13939_04024 [Talaromyces rugulosus]QKX56916.1 hypothetical protein TRUGW13939_04024 [Talaromyces rugulosus]